MVRKILTFIFAISAIFVTSASTIEDDISTISIKRGEAPVDENLKPIATIEDKDGKYSISVGGNINMRIGYDFNGSITKHPDFIPALIPVPGDFDSEKFLYMDATTSRIEIKGRAHSKKIGDVELCLNMDFRGGAIGSYTPRVRLAYINVGDFTVGRNFTTFCDLGSAAPNIDFEGPVVCPYIYTTQIRYTHSWDEGRFNIGAALEYNGYQSMKLSGNYKTQKIYLPVVPAYVEYKWDSELGSHIRLTGLYKNNPLYDTAKKSDINLHGWGTQISGSLGVGEKFKLYYSATCGEGISDFMQDTYGNVCDVTLQNGENPQLTFMNGWQAAGLIEVTDRTLISMGYSAVSVSRNNTRFDNDDYRRSEYIFANVFFSLTPRVNLATEYLWGKRTNINDKYNTANRINTMVQYTF